MLRRLLIQNCVGGIWCASARASEVAFQACALTTRPSLRFRINGLREVWNSVAQTLLQILSFLDAIDIQRFTRTPMAGI